MRGLAIELSKSITGREYDRMVKRGTKRFKQLKLTGVRYRGAPTVKTWDHYEVSK